MGKVVWKNCKEGFFLPPENDICECQHTPGKVIMTDDLNHIKCKTCGLLVTEFRKKGGGQMTLIEFGVFYDKLVEIEKKLLSIKGIEYSGTEDRFNNFKKLGTDLLLPPEKILWIYLKKHLDGILSYINGEYAGGEPIIGRINDARNYLALLAGMIASKEVK